MRTSRYCRNRRRPVGPGVPGAETTAQVVDLELAERARAARRPRRTARRPGSVNRHARARPRIRSRGLCSMRVISSAAAAGSRPNLEPSCPVSTCAWVSAVTPGMIRTRTSWVRPRGTIASSRSTSSGPSTTTRPIPFSTAMAISSVLFALPCSTISAGSTPAFSAVRISPPPATSSPSPSWTITRWTAVHGKALDAKTTREFGQRRRVRRRYSRARARSAASATTSTGVPNSAARSSARQPADGQHPVGVGGAARWEQLQQLLMPASGSAPSIDGSASTASASLRRPLPGRRGPEPANTGRS